MYVVSFFKIDSLPYNLVQAYLIHVIVLGVPQLQYPKKSVPRHKGYSSFDRNFEGYKIIPFYHRTVDKLT